MTGFEIENDGHVFTEIVDDDSRLQGQNHREPAIMLDSGRMAQIRRRIDAQWRQIDLRRPIEGNGRQPLPLHQ